MIRYIYIYLIIIIYLYRELIVNIVNYDWKVLIYEGFKVDKPYFSESKHQEQ